MAFLFKTFLRQYLAINVFLCSLFFAVLSGCSTQLTLQNANVKPKAAAILIAGNNSYYIDEVNVPRMFDQRIGKKRNNVGDFLAWVHTDQTKLENWCENELKLFFQRHGKKISTDFDKADFIVQCNITTIWTEKKWQWKYNDKFSAHVKFHIKIAERASKKTVLSKNLKFDFNTERAYERNDQISDEQNFNYIL